MWIHEVYTTTRLRNTNKWTETNPSVQRELQQLGNVRDDEANLNFSMYLP